MVVVPLYEEKTVPTNTIKLVNIEGGIFSIRYYILEILF
jgi:hypothetical protein